MSITIHGAGFDYPDTMPPPQNAQDAFFRTEGPFVLQYETPIQIRIVTIMDAVFYNCLVVYQQTSLDILTKKPPIVRADINTINNFGTAKTKVLCGF